MANETIKGLWRKANEGNAQALHDLGILYLHGAEEAPKNVPLARALLTRAAQGGVINAANVLAKSYLDETEASYNPASALAAVAVAVLQDGSKGEGACRGSRGRGSCLGGLSMCGEEGRPTSAEKAQKQ